MKTEELNKLLVVKKFKQAVKVIRDKRQNKEEEEKKINIAITAFKEDLTSSVLITPENIAVIKMMIDTKTSFSLAILQFLRDLGLNENFTEALPHIDRLSQKNAYQMTLGKIDRLNHPHKLELKSMLHAFWKIQTHQTTSHQLAVAINHYSSLGSNNHDNQREKIWDEQDVEVAVKSLKQILSANEFPVKIEITGAEGNFIYSLHIYSLQLYRP